MELIRILNHCHRFRGFVYQAHFSADKKSIANSFSTISALKNCSQAGVVEGLNNKAKVTMRKSYGFRTYRVLELALYHSPGKLPDPESTHDFF
jgi:hypothetical protein